jgi:hypothetical protein
MSMSGLQEPEPGVNKSSFEKDGLHPPGHTSMQVTGRVFNHFDLNQLITN